MESFPQICKPFKSICSPLSCDFMYSTGVGGWVLGGGGGNGAL